MCFSFFLNYSICPGHSNPALCLFHLLHDLLACPPSMTDTGMLALTDTSLHGATPTSFSLIAKETHNIFMVKCQFFSCWTKFNKKSVSLDASDFINISLMSCQAQSHMEIVVFVEKQCQHFFFPSVFLRVSLYSFILHVTQTCSFASWTPLKKKKKLIIVNPRNHIFVFYMYIL